jgi:hypothetical protein
MAKTQLTFRFDYSDDGGSTWKESTPVTFTVVDWDLKIVNELLVEHVLDADNKIVRYWAQRVQLRITVDVPNFTPSADSGHTDWIWLQAWKTKPLKRISHDSGETLDGANYFASATNAYYVECEPEEEGEKINADWRKMEMVLTVTETL